VTFKIMSQSRFRMRSSWLIVKRRGSRYRKKGRGKMYDEGFSTLVTTSRAEDIRRPVREREEEDG